MTNLSHLATSISKQLTGEFVSEALNRAKNGLQFEDIFQTNVSAHIKDDFDPKFNTITDEDYGIQFKHLITQSNVLELNGGESNRDLFRVYIEVGVRLFPSKDNDNQPKNDPLAQLEASYCIDYRITAAELKLDQEALDAFALHNASYHLWPYWREYLMSQCVRMNLPKISLPVRLIPPANTAQK